MSVESQVNNIADLNPTYPQADDPVSQGDNHIRNIKKALKDTFPNIDGTVNPSDEELNQLVGQDLPGDVSALEARVTKNEGDISNNAAGISNNAAGIIANTDYIKDVEVIAVNNERDISGLEASKADKTYVDSELAKKADKTYVDAQDNALSGRISTLENASAPGLTPHSINDHTDVNTSGAVEGNVLTYIGGQWVPLKVEGSGMINIVDQPSNVGDFNLEPTQMAYVANVQGPTNAARNYTLIVPSGMVFAFEYMFAIGQGSIELGGLVIDGVSVLNSGSLDYDNSGGPTWPGNDKSSIIRVKDRMVVSWLPDGSSTSQLFLAGMFAEA
jgi:hypothetical protein